MPRITENLPPRLYLCIRGKFKLMHYQSLQPTHYHKKYPPAADSSAVIDLEKLDESSSV
jgi:hypothetical protein